MDPIKIQGIANWLTPTSVKQVRSFMSFCNFYRPFIFQFSHIAWPLNQLTKKNTPWEWGPKQQQAFETLQKWITSEPVLIQPKLEEPFEIEVDVSGYAIGAILIQRDEKGKRDPIAYFSTTLTVTFGLHLLRRRVGLLSFFSTPSHHQSPVRYDLTALYDMMRSCGGDD